MNNRPHPDAYFMEIARVIASRSTCLRRHIGAVIVKGKQIVSTGYNGAPAGHPHCADLGCAREHVPSGQRSELCRAAHAEQNAICQAARLGIALGGEDMSYLHAKHFKYAVPIRVRYSERDRADLSQVLALKVRSETGALVPYGDHAAFARETLRMLRDPDLLRRRSEAARRWAETFSWPRCLSFLSSPKAFIHPNGSSTRLRFRWLIS